MRKIFGFSLNCKNCLFFPLDRKFFLQKKGIKKKQRRGIKKNKIWTARRDVIVLLYEFNNNNNNNTKMMTMRLLFLALFSLSRSRKSSRQRCSSHDVFGFVPSQTR